MLAALVAAFLLLAPPPDTTTGPAASPAEQATTAPGRSPLTLRTHASGVGLWIGGSPRSMALIAQTQGARFALVGLSFRHVLATEDHLAVRYTADLIPAAVLSYTSPPHASEAGAAPIEPARSPIYGVGGAPAGLQFIYRTHRRTQPFFGGSAGLIAFPDPVPDSRGRRLNYTFDISVGLRWVLGAHRVLTVGYRFHHLSNGFRGEINPGFDANVIYVGLSTQ